MLPSRARVLPHDATTGFATEPDDAAIDPSRADGAHRANRRLRIILVLATAFAWVMIAFLIRLVLP